MFVLSEFKDTIVIHPKDLHLPKRTTIEHTIHKKYTGKLFHQVGMCIALFDLLHVGDGIVQHSEGSAYFKVRFQLIVFRPSRGEIINAQILSSDENGIRASTGFFDDIFIPPDCLPKPHRYDESEHVWIWEYEENSLYLDPGDILRLQVKDMIFEEVRTAEKKDHALMKVIGDITSQGLGSLSWWQ
ncbi:hypothetical protein HMI54_011369 [Coelomomyces lativittatus]|nr:hypothetical protein HMI56_004445 [Coelomomyces lativittatus]KAJ1499821.1 hypothetical protein HMI54_011369 [Coelomomyces lativittatus]KAJ1511974.1 hypothetical protein HMI55_006400 [Coelomomyces lativittatus]